MKNNDLKNRAQIEFKNKYRSSAFFMPFIIIFCIVFMIIMALNGIKDSKLYLVFSLCILIGIGNFSYSIYILNKIKKQEDNDENKIDEKEN